MPLYTENLVSSTDLAGLRGVEGCYLLHFSAPYRHARHYLGYAQDIAERLAAHRAGNGARLVQVVRAAGPDFVLARAWPGGGRALERQLKRQHNSPRFCPLCRGR